MIRQVKCLVCTGVLKDVQDPLARLLMKAHLTVEYINPMVEGFHCRKQQCKELFHQFMPLKDNCCEIADLFMVELLCRATLSLFCLHVLRIQRVVSPDDGSEATTCRLAINLIKRIMDTSTAEQKAVRKHRARRALWRLANEPPADFDSQDPFDAMLMDRIEYYANGGWLGETGCLICSEREECEIWDIYYNHDDLQGFHCAQPECVHKFHQIVPSHSKCCELLYDPDHDPLGDPFENGDPFPINSNPFMSQ